MSVCIRLVHDVLSGMADDTPFKQVAGPGNSFFNGGEAQKGNNNYARPGGQNTGNFMTDRNSSRVLQVPGGASSICFGNENAAPSESWLPSGRRGGAQQSNASQITF